MVNNYDAQHQIENVPVWNFFERKIESEEKYMSAGEIRV